MSSETQALLRVHEYHGSNRIRDVAKLSNFDLVVTTFETLASDWYYIRPLPPLSQHAPASLSLTHTPHLVSRSGNSRGKKKGELFNMNAPKQCPVHRINWHRIVLDEAHKVKFVTE